MCSTSTAARRLHRRRVMEFAVVPEPSTIALFAGRLLIAGSLARCRQA